MPQEEVERVADAEDGTLLKGWENTIVLGEPERRRPASSSAGAGSSLR